MNDAIFSRIIKRIDAYRDDMVKLQIGLTAIPALAPESGGDGESDKADYLKTFLKTAGFHEPTSIDAPDDRVSSGFRPNFIATVPGRHSTKTVWILTHLDVVPPGEQSFWKEDPYTCYVEDHKVFGRGTEDNQQDLVASLFAAKAFLDEGIVPENSIGLVFVSDEETGSDRGLKYVLQKARGLFGIHDLIVVPDSGNKDGTMIEVAEKSMIWVRFKTTGKQCHGSQPALGRNAFLAASHLVVKLGGLYGIFNASDPLYEPPTSTFEPTRKDANVPNINTIPGEDVFYMDCRVLPCYPVADVLAEMRRMADDIEKTFGVAVEISAVQAIDAPPPTPVGAPVVEALKWAVRDVYGVQAYPVGIGGGTVAAPFRQEGFPAAVWSRIDYTAHQPNEYCLIENMIGNAKVYAHLFLQG